MNNTLMFSSNNQAWATRWEYFYQIEEYFDTEFILDPCCEVDTAKCPLFFTQEDNMFSVDSWANHIIEERAKWVRKNAFMNPEYGRQQPMFVRECINQLSKGMEQIVCLIPARTDTKLFHDTVMKYSNKIVFYEGRLVFGSDKYWEFVWNEPTMININGSDKPNTMYQKFGKFNSAPFPSMLVEFTKDSIESLTEQPTIDTLKATKVSYK